MAKKYYHDEVSHIDYYFYFSLHKYCTTDSELCQELCQEFVRCLYLKIFSSDL